MLHAVNDGARAQEEQGFEEGVGDQMEDRGHIRADAQRGDHEAKLRDRGVGQHALDVVLRDGDRRRKDRRERADERHDGHRLWVEADEREHANDRVHARRNHRRGMDHRADGSWAFHRVRQPDVQRELRRFANCADEEQQTDQACGRETEETTRNCRKRVQNFFAENLAEGKCAGYRIEISNPQAA